MALNNVMLKSYISQTNFSKNLHSHITNHSTKSNFLNAYAELVVSIKKLNCINITCDLCVNKFASCIFCNSSLQLIPHEIILRMLECPSHNMS